MLNKRKDQLTRIIMHNARENIANLAGHLISSPSQEKENILAELDFNRDIADLCQLALI